MAKLNIPPNYYQQSAVRTRHGHLNSLPSSLRGGTTGLTGTCTPEIGEKYANLCTKNKKQNIHMLWAFPRNSR